MTFSHPRRLLIVVAVVAALCAAGVFLAVALAADPARRGWTAWLWASLAGALVSALGSAAVVAWWTRISARRVESGTAAAEDGDSRLTAILEINKKIGAMAPTDALLTSIAEEAARLLDVDNAGFRLLEGGDLVLAGLAGTARHTMKRARLKVGESFSGRVVAQGRTMIEDIASALDLVPEHRLADRELGYTTILGVPLRVADRTIGALTFRARRPFTPRDRELAEAFAGQAAIAIEHARLYGETAKSAQRMSALADLGRLLSDTLVPDVVGQRIVDSIRQLLDVQSAALLRLRPESGDLEVMSVADVGPSFMPGMVFTEGTGTSGFAVRTREPVITDDLLSDPRFTFAPEVRARIEAAGYRSVLTVPLVVRERVIGALSVGDAAGRGFDAEEVRLARAFADQAALALENTRLYAEARERLWETTTLVAVSQVLSQAAPAQEVMRRAAREMTRAFGADMTGVYVVDATRQRLVPFAGYHVPRDLLLSFLQRPIVLADFPILRAAWREGRALWSRDPTSDPRFEGQWALALPPHSVLFAAALSHGEPVGALFIIWWGAAHDATPSEIRLMESIAAQVGLTFENFELSRQTEVKLRETETLLSVSRALASTLDQDALLRHFLRRLAEVIDADTVGVWTVDETGEWLDPHVGYRVPAAQLAALRATRLSLLGNDFYGEAARTRRPVFSPDVTTDPRLPRALVDVVPHKSHLFVPIVVKDRMIGGLAALWWERVREFSDTELTLTEAIANQAGVTLEHLRLFQENRRQVNELSALYDLSRAVTGQLDREAVVKAIETHVARVFDVRNFVLVLRDPDTRVIDLVHAIVDGQRHFDDPREYGRRSVGLISVALETGRSMRTDDYVAECARHGVKAVARSAAFRHVLLVPLKIGDAVFGAIAVAREEGSFTAADERLLTNIADLGALALSSARLFDERARAYRDLATAQDELVRTERLRALGEMASGIAHDFNNLLAAILGRAQLVLRRVQEPQLVRWLEVIQRAAIDGAQTVRRLQEFTRVRRDPPLVSVDLNQVILDALEMTQSRWREEAQSRGVTIEMRTDLDPLPPIAGDAAGLREAFTNLILNAVDAMPSGGALTVRTRQENGHIGVVVRDTGVGMSDSVREKIFDPFFTTKGPQGTGLGLSMTYGIVSRHGATIEVESREGEGATFQLTFPVATEARSAHPASDETPVAPRRLRCLVVDDEEAVGMMLGDALEISGHQVVVVNDGASAIARFREEPFDVVFTDLAMPGVSGWQVVREVKAVAPTVPVFLVTGFGVELSADEQRSQGVEAILAKPVKIEDLLSAVARAAARS